MIGRNIDCKIKPQHLERKAIIYLRQSTEKQVEQNIESQRLQYSLADRARDLGFIRVEVIDTDLGSSASIGSSRREGFDRLLSSVALGEVGIVLSREVSRLSRTDKDWCRLLEVCQLFGTLIGDAEQVYDLNLMDDQLILGIKGTMSVVELNILRMRLIAGMEAKARRGELVRLLPPGYVYDELNMVVKDPDIRVREAIENIFKKFTEIVSIRQTLLYFRNNKIELPVNKYVGKRKKIVWQLPTYSFIKDVLVNAFYAGAYIWGRRPVEKVFSEGRVERRMGKNLEPEECKVFIRDHHEGYITWKMYEENARKIRGNSLNLGKDESVGAIRAGRGILAGLLRCGRCGRKLHVRYWGRSGSAARYLCKGDFDTGGRYCLAFGSGMVDKRFSKELLEAISPYGVSASLEALEQLRGRENGKRKMLVRQLEQLEYESRIAFEQYNEVDPRHRLVASELERRWNAKLEEVEDTKRKLSEIDNRDHALTKEDTEKILDMGEEFSSLWESEHCSPELKKKIIRTVIEEIIVNQKENEEILSFIIHWKGGTHTCFEMSKPKTGDAHKTDIEDIDLIREMAVRYGDDEIARVLNKLGRRTGMGNRWNEERVVTVRKKHAIPGQKRSAGDPNILTLGQAVKYCKVSQTTIKRLVDSGILKKKQAAPWAPWEIKRTDLDSEKIREIINRLRETGKLEIDWDNANDQGSLFN